MENNGSKALHKTYQGEPEQVHKTNQRATAIHEAGHAEIKQLVK